MHPFTQQVCSQPISQACLQSCLIALLKRSCCEYVSSSRSNVLAINAGSEELAELESSVAKQKKWTVVLAALDKMTRCHSECGVNTPREMLLERNSRTRTWEILFATFCFSLLIRCNVFHMIRWLTDMSHIQSVLCFLSFFQASSAQCAPSLCLRKRWIFTWSCV